MQKKSKIVIYKTTITSERKHMDSIPNALIAREAAEGLSDLTLSSRYVLVGAIALGALTLFCKEVFFTPPKHRIIEITAEWVNAKPQKEPSPEQEKSALAILRFMFHDKETAFARAPEGISMETMVAALSEGSLVELEFLQFLLSIEGTSKNQINDYRNQMVESILNSVKEYRRLNVDGSAAG